jgi:hypothetical protein
MNKVAEIVVTGLLLVGMYCAIPTSFAQGDPVIRAKQTVLLADGSDPMPLCRNCRGK